MGARFKTLLTLGATSGLGGFYFFNKRTVSCSGSGSSTLEQPSKEEQLNLKQVQIFFRHGSRSPIKRLPGIEPVFYDVRYILGPIPHAEIPYIVKNINGGSQPDFYFESKVFEKVEFEGGIPSGCLTKIGKDQGYELGTELRREYVDERKLINGKFSEKDIFVRTSNVRRTIGTLEGVMAGMFGKDNIDGPVSFYTLPAAEEFIYPNGRQCPTLYKIVTRSIDYINNHPTVVRMKQEVFNIIGDDHEISAFDVQHWRDNVITRQTLGLPVPGWMVEKLPLFAEAGVITHRSFACGAPSDEKLALTITAGPLLGMVHDYMKESIHNSTDKRRMCLYSGHDTTLTPLLVSLGVFDEEWPPYCADLRFELYNNSQGDHFIKILYLGKEMKPPGVTSTLIPYTEFVELIKPYEATYKQFRERCVDVPPHLLQQENASKTPDF